MDNDYVLVLDSPMLYYIINGTIKRRCLALKNISLEQERLEMKHRRIRRQVFDKYSGDEPSQMEDGYRSFTCPFGVQSLDAVAKKADDLKDLVTSQRALECAKANKGNNYNFTAVREILNSCESKCHELLTHLANIDWELDEFEETLTMYHAKMEEAMTEYNMELNALYKRRLGIILGDYEPTDEECILPSYLDRTIPPKYLTTERIFERLFSTRSNRGHMDGNRIPGVPKFWFHSLLIALRQVDVIESSDYAALEYLVDVRYYYDTDCEFRENELTNSDHRTQVLLFYFDKNPHFSNRILSKTIHIDKSRRTGRQMFDGLWVNKIEGCTINWYRGQDLTRGPSFRGYEDDEEIDSLLPPFASFFNFFGAHGLDYGRKVTRFDDEDEPVEVDLDYDVFMRFRDFIVPHAIIAYSRGNLYGFECERVPGETLKAEKLNYLNSLFDPPSTDV